MKLKAGYYGCCAVWRMYHGPDYRNRRRLPDRWQAEKDASSGSETHTPEKLKTWWKSFDDSRLDRLMDWR